MSVYILGYKYRSPFGTPMIADTEKYGNTHNKTSTYVMKNSTNDIEKTIDINESEIKSRPICEFPVTHDKLSSTHLTKHPKMRFDELLNKPIFIKNVAWSSNDPVGLLSTINVPEDLLNNELIRIPFRASCRYRFNGYFVLQVAGTPMHAGTVLASVRPIWSYSDSFNTLLLNPHGFLSANESTPVKIEIPFYSPSKYLNTHQAPFPSINYPIGNNNYSKLTMSVLNPLSPPTNGTLSVTISVHVVFTDLDFRIPKRQTVFVPQCGSCECTVNVHKQDTNEPLSSFFAKSFCCCFPRYSPQALVKNRSLWSGTQSWATNAIDGIVSFGKTITSDFFDWGRSKIREYTGLHNPNKQLESSSLMRTKNNPNLVDRPCFYSKLDAFGDFETIADYPVFKTDQDEMDIKYLLGQRQLASAFTINSIATSGTLLFARPISPYYTRDNQHFNIHTTLYHLTKKWNGDIRMYLQSSMSSMQYVKLLVVLDYSNDSTLGGATFVAPSMSETTNLLTYTLEFAGGGQIAEVKLPYGSLNRLCDNSLSPYVNSVQNGMVYIYLLQPLVSPNNLPLSIQMNVYFSCEDVNLYGFCSHTVSGGTAPPLPSTTFLDVAFDQLDAYLNPAPAISVTLDKFKEYVAPERREKLAAYMASKEFLPIKQRHAAATSQADAIINKFKPQSIVVLPSEQCDLQAQEQTVIPLVTLYLDL